MSYIHNKMWSDLEPTKPVALWVCQNVLHLSPFLISEHRGHLNELVYRVFYGLGASTNKYVTAWNAARADLIVEWIDPPHDDGPIIHIPSEPDGDIAYWLVSEVLLFEDIEIEALTGVDVDDVQEGGYALVPLIKSCYRELKKIKLQTPILQRWHRARHIMIRYYLDAEFHEI